MPPTVAADPVVAALAALPLPTLALDADLRVVAANAAARGLLAAAREAEGRPLAELLPPGAIDPVQTAILRAHALRRRQRVRPFPAADALSSPLGAAALDVVAVDDRASRVRTLVIADDADDEACDLAAARLGLIESARDLIWSLDRDLRWTFLNGACGAVYGLPPERLLGRPFAEVVPAAQAAVDLRLLGRVLAGERVVDHETRHLRVDGAAIDLVVSAEPLRDARGRVVGAVGSAQDITLRRRAERLVQESEWRFRRLIEQAPFAILVKRDGLVVLANAAAASLLGADPVGRGMMDVIARADRGAYADAIALVRAGREAPPFAATIARPDGAARVELVCCPFTHDGDGAELIVARRLA